MKMDEALIVKKCFKRDVTGPRNRALSAGESYARPVKSALSYLQENESLSVFCGWEGDRDWSRFFYIITMTTKLIYEVAGPLLWNVIRAE